MQESPRYTMSRFGDRRPARRVPYFVVPVLWCLCILSGLVVLGWGAMIVTDLVQQDSDHPKPIDAELVMFAISDFLFGILCVALVLARRSARRHRG